MGVKLSRAVLAVACLHRGLHSWFECCCHLYGMQALPEEAEMADDYGLGTRSGLEEAVEAVIATLGMAPCEGTDAVPPNARCVLFSCLTAAPAAMVKCSYSMFARMLLGRTAPGCALSFAAPCPVAALFAWRTVLWNVTLTSSSCPKRTDRTWCCLRARLWAGSKRSCGCALASTRSAAWQ